MKDTPEKLTVLFGDINKYYKDHHSRISLVDFEQSCLENITIEQFLGNIFTEREFNVKVSKGYIERILLEYELDFNSLNAYCEELKILKDEEDERRRLNSIKEKERLEQESLRTKRRNIVFISVVLISFISTCVYYDFYQKKQSLEEQIARDKREEGILIQKGVIENYFSLFTEGNLNGIMDFWSVNPKRYQNLKVENSSETLETKLVQEAIKSNLDDFMFENEIQNILPLKEMSFDVKLIQKRVDKDTKIEFEIIQIVNLVFDDSNKIVEEFVREEKVSYVSKVKRSYYDAKYEGGIRNDKRSGYGEMYYSNGDIYKGNWVNDERMGYGEMYYKNGDLFKGEWNGYIKGEGEMIYASVSNKSSLVSKNQKTKIRFPDWANNHPNVDEEYVYFLGNDGKWYTNGNLLKYSYGLYEIDYPISQINGFAYVGTFEGHSYFRSIGITHLPPLPFDTGTETGRLPTSKNIGSWTIAHSKSPKTGYLVEINTVEEQDYLQNKLKGTNKAYWIGMKNINGKFIWLRDQ